MPRSNISETEYVNLVKISNLKAHLVPIQEEEMAKALKHKKWILLMSTGFIVCN